MLNPDLINPAAFADEKQQLQTQIAFADLAERILTHEYLADTQAQIEISLQGGRDRYQRPFLDLTLHAHFNLICQRCMQSMPFELNDVAHIVLFNDETQLDKAMLSDEELEGMVMTDELNVRELVEDQILMALPYSPRHDNCDNQAVETINRDKPNPFAVLAGLKRD